MLGLKLNLGPINTGMIALQAKKQAGLTAFAESAAETFENYAKRNYPWTNRSYRASKSIRGDYMWQGNTVKVSIEIEVEYGVYLEYAHGKRWAVCEPTVQACSAKVLKGLSRIIG